MAGGNMGDLWFTLGVKDKTSKTVNQALKTIKDVDGAISVLNKKYIEAQQALKLAIGAKSDPKTIQSLRDEVKVWSQGVDNALAYQKMIQKVNKELENIKNLKNLNIGADTTKLQEAENLLKRFKDDLSQVTLKSLGLGGTDFNTYLSRFSKALGLTMNDVKQMVDTFRKDNSLTDAASRTATLERALAGVQKKLLDIKTLQSEAWKGNYNGSSLLAAGNRLRGVERRIQKMIADPDLLNSEAKYRTLLSDIGTAAAKASLDLEKYNTEKKKVQETRATNDKEKQALDDTIERYNKLRSILSEGLNVRRGDQLTDEEINRLNTGLQGLAQKILELRSAINSGKGATNLFTSVYDKIQISDLEQLIRLYQKFNEERTKSNKTTLNNYADNYQKAVSALTRVNELLGKTYEARNRGAALGMDTTRLEQDIQTLRELRNTLEILKNSPSSEKIGKIIDPDTEARLANIKRHIKDITSEMGAARARTNEATTAARDLASAFDRVHNSASKSSQVLSDIKSLFFQGGIVFAAQQFANSIIKTGGDIVQQHIALRSILGDVQKADTLFAQTQQLALQSPFTFQELNRDVKQLAAYGVDTDRLYDTTKRLADVASGLGVSFERLGLAYGQVKARSWLDGKELRQFAYAGLPMLQKIADLYNEIGKNGKRNYTTSDVRNMITKRQVSFEDVDEVFKRLTDEGGQFYNMQFVLSDTLLGRWNKLQDAWTIMLGKFADGSNVLGGVFTGAIDAATTLIQKLDQLSPIVMSFGAMFALRKGASALSARFGAGTIITDMQKAQSIALTNFQIRQMTQVAEGKITMEQAKQNITNEKNLLASKEAASTKYMQLVAEGKLSAFQLGRLAANQKIDVSLVRQLVTTGQISRYQALLILQAERYAGTLKGVWAQMQLGATSLLGSIKGLFTWGNALMVGIGVAMSAVMSKQQQMAEMQSKAEGVAGKYANKAQEINDTLTQVNGKISEDSIQAMEGALSKAGQLTDEVKNQVSEASTLAEKYDILKNKMQETLTMAANLKNSGIIANALNASGGDVVKTPDEGTGGAIWRNIINAGKWIHDFLPFTDVTGNVTENVSQINTLGNAIQNMTHGLATSFDSVNKALKQTTDAAHDSVFYEKVSKLPFQQKMEEILQSPYAQDFINNLSKVDSNAGWTASRLRDYIKDFDSYLKKLVKNNVPNIVEQLKRDMGLLGTDTKNWSQQQVNTFVWMFNQIMAAAGEMSDYVRSKVWKSFVASAGLGEQLNPSGIRVYTALDKNGNKIRDYYIGQEGDDKKGHYVITGFRKKKDGTYEPLKQYNPAADKTEKPSLTGSSEPDSGSKKNKGGKSDADRAAERARREAERRERAYLRARQKEEQSIQKYYETYKTWRQIEGENRAKSRVSADERFKNISGTYEDPSKLAENYKKLAESISKASGGYAKMSDERKQLYNDLMAKAADAEADIMLEKAKDQIDAFKEMLELMSKRYDWYQRLAKVAGKESAASFVFGDAGHSSSYYQYLKRRVYNGLKSAGGTQLGVDYSNSNPNGSTSKQLDTLSVMGVSFPKIDLNQLGEGTTLEEALAMPYSKLEKALGTEQATVLQKFKEARDKLDESIVGSLEQGYTYFEDYNAELDSINQKYDEQIERLKERNKLEQTNDDYISDEALNQYTTVLKQQQARDVAAVNYKQLQNSDVYRNFFGSSLLMSTRGAEKYAKVIRDGVDKAFEAGAITAEDYNQAFEKIDSTMKEVRNNRSEAFNYFFGDGAESVLQDQYNKGQQQVNAANIRKNNALKAKAEAQAKGDFGAELQADIDIKNADSDAADGQDIMDKAKKGLQAMAIVDKIVNKINQNVQSLKGLFDDISNSIETFAGSDKAQDFKNSGAYAFVSGLAGAAQGATDAWNSLKSGNVMGVLEGGYRSIMAIPEAFAKRHDAKLDKAIQELSRINKTLENVQSSIDRNLSNTLGSVYAYVSKEKDAQAIRDGIKEYNRANSTWLAKWLNKVTGQNINRSRYSEGTYAVMVHADETGAAYDQELASFMMQYDNLETQLDKERKKKNTDKDKVQDYNNQLDELKDKIATFAKDMAKNLYGIDVASWAKELSDTIVDAWASGEDAAEKYHDKVQELMKELAKNIISKRIMEIALKPTEDLIEKRMAANSGKLTEDDINDIADSLMSQQDYAVDTITGILDSLKGKGLDLSNTGSASMSSSIKGMTETTADLLAAYLNAIRADVSVIRQVQGIYLPKLDITATAQLQQLNMIAANTLRNADAAEQISTSTMEILTIVRAVTNDTKRLSVTVK